MAGYGMTEEQISEVLGVDRVTIYRTKKEVEFCNTLAKCKEEADLKVVNSLYRRAIGEYPEDKAFCFEGTVVKTQLMQHAPDTKACELWLVNRRKSEWKDVPGEDPNSERSSRMLVQIFNGVRAKEQKTIEDGADPMNVLFSPRFAATMEAKKNGHTNGNGTSIH